MGEIFATHVSAMRKVSRIYTDFLEFNNKKTIQFKTD